jgi:hypothetical protein
MSLLPDWLTGFDSANADAAAAADAQLQTMNSIDYGPGGKFYSPALADAVAANRAAELANGGYGADAQRGQVDQAFTDTLDAQAKSIIGGPLGVLWASLKAMLKAVPWWLWILGLGAAFLWLGGATWLRGSLSKKKNYEPVFQKHSRRGHSRRHRG